MSTLDPIRRRSHARMRAPSSGIASVEMELLAERANALGRAGARLEQAIRDWRRFDSSGRSDESEASALLDRVRETAYALLVQRDCAGFRCANLQWIRDHYDIPDAALRRI